MAGKYRAWLEPDALERIANWAANGCTVAELARNMGVGERTLYTWMASHEQIMQAVKRGRAMACEAVENSMFRRAVGLTVTEETEEFRGELRDGKPYNGTVVRRTVTKQLPPDTAAIIFYLKNRMPERYSDRRVNEVEVTAPAVVLGVEPTRAG